MRVVGIDAYRGGWVAMTLTDSRFTSLNAGMSLVQLCDGAPDAVGIDMPIGLLDAGWRECDTLARRLLGPRRSSVFAIPPRQVWAAPDYPSANRACRDLTGKGFSIQAWGLRQKLLAANEYREQHPIYEVHPELAFTAMRGHPLQHSKHTGTGLAARRELLSQNRVLPDDIKPPRNLGLNDVLDAAAVAWSAHRIATGVATTIPDPPQLDPDGREIAIRY